MLNHVISVLIIKQLILAFPYFIKSDASLVRRAMLQNPSKNENQVNLVCSHHQKQNILPLHYTATIWVARKTTCIFKNFSENKLKLLTRRSVSPLRLQTQRFHAFLYNVISVLIMYASNNASLKFMDQPKHCFII